MVYCSGKCGSKNSGKKGQGGVGVAVRTSITPAAHPPEFNSDCLLKATHELRGRAKAFTFYVAYGPINMHCGRPWTELLRRYLDTNNCSC